MVDKTIINNWTGGGTLQTWTDGEWQILYVKDSAGNCVTLSLNSSEACRLAYAVSPQPKHSCPAPPPYAGSKPRSSALLLRDRRCAPSNDLRSSRERPSVAAYQIAAFHADPEPAPATKLPGSLPAGHSISPGVFLPAACRRRSVRKSVSAISWSRFISSTPSPKTTNRGIAGRRRFSTTTIL